jgi:hypothetical protein
MRNPEKHDSQAVALCSIAHRAWSRRPLACHPRPKCALRPALNTAMNLAEVLLTIGMTLVHCQEHWFHTRAV